MQTRTLIDLFAIAPAVNLQGKHQVRTFIGFFLTLSVLTITILLAIYMSDDMVHGKNPIVNQNLVHGALTNNILILNSDQLQMKFGLSTGQSNTYFVNPNIYTVIAQTWVAKDYIDPQSGCSELWTLNLAVCPPNTGDGQLYCLSNKIPSQYRNCLKDKTVKDLFVLVNSQDIWIDFMKCVGNNCFVNDYDYPSLNDYIEDAYIIIERSDWTINTQNYSTPIVKYDRIERFGIIATMYKIITFDLGVLDMITDDGWILSNPKNQSVIYVETLSTDLFSKPDLSTPQKFARVYLRSHGNKAEYGRKYEKFQDVIARVNGIVAVCVVVAGVLAYPFAKAKMYEEAIKDLYHVRIKKAEEEKLKRKKSGEATKNRKKKKMKKSRSRKKSGNIELANKIDGTNQSMLSAIPMKSEAAMKGVDVSNKTLIETLPTEEIVLDVAHEKLDQSQVAPKCVPVQTSLLSSKNTGDTNKQNQSSEAQTQATPTMMIRATSENESRKVPVVGPSDENSSPTCLLAKTIRFKSKEESKEKRKETDKEREGEEKNDSEEEEDEEGEEIVDIDKKTPFSVNIVNWVKSIFNRDQKIQALNVAALDITEHVDIVTLIHMQRELENLKRCMLTPEQRAVFDNLAKPTIMLDLNMKSQKPELNCNESYRGDRKGLKKAYMSLKKNKDKNEINERLILLYDKLREDSKNE